MSELKDLIAKLKKTKNKEQLNLTKFMVEEILEKVEAKEEVFLCLFCSLFCLCCQRCMSLFFRVGRRRKRRSCDFK